MSDIAFGQIAGPNPRLALADTDIDRDRDFAALHRGWRLSASS